MQIPVGKAHLPPEQIGASTAVGVNAYIEEALRWLPDQPGVDSLPSETVALGGLAQSPSQITAPVLRAPLQDRARVPLREAPSPRRLSLSLQARHLVLDRSMPHSWG